MIYNATIKVYQFIHNHWQYIDHDVTSSKKEFFEMKKRKFTFYWSIDLGGDYYRLLTDGSYAIQVKSPGYKTQMKYVHVNNKPNENNAQRLDFILQQD